VGIEENNFSAAVSISPNPTTTQLTIQNGEFRIESVEVYSVMGEKIISLTPNPSPHGEGSVSINVSSLAPGIYFVKVRGEKEERVAKFVKQ